MLKKFISILTYSAFTLAALAAEPKGLFHPLDALTPDEIALTVKLLKDSGAADDGTVYPALTLKPASKDAIAKRGL